MTENEESIINDLQRAQPGGKIDREELMQKTSQLIKMLHRRTTVAKLKECKGDRTRLAYARATVQAVQAYAGILKDAELDDLKRRIENLEYIKTGGGKERQQKIRFQKMLNE
jgi:hypothetical protein